MGRAVVALLLGALASTGVARADDTGDGVAGDHLFAGDGLYRPPIEWSTWLRGAYGIASDPSSHVVARSIEPIAPPASQHDTWELGAGAEASLAASQHGDIRLGAWLELRGLAARDLFAGGELVVTRVPRRLDFLLYEGHGLAALRVGRSSSRATAQLVWGYVAPYWLEGPCRQRFFGIYTGVCAPRPHRLARMMAGVRVVATVTRALDDVRAWPREWSATIGIEFEPIGALRANFALRSWYRPGT